MAGGEDEDQKTEQPTSKKLEDAYKKGNVPFSREVGNFMIMLMIALTVSYFSPNILRSTTLMLTPFLSDAEQMPVDASGVGLILSKLVFGSLGIFVRISNYNNSWKPANQLVNLQIEQKVKTDL